MGRRAGRTCGWALLGCVLSVAPALGQGLVGPGSQEAQATPTDSAAVMAPADTGSVASDTRAYGRETFTYPEVQDRRDPFAPLTAGEEIGPRFADLELSGLIYAPDVGSVAVLTDRTTQRRYRVREGDWLGDARVDRIRADEVAFTVAGFGLSRTEVLRVAREDQE